MSNEEMIVALNTVVEALNKHDLKLLIEDYKRLREENERLREKVKDDWKSTPATTEIKPHELVMLEAIKQAEIRGAAEMLEFIDSRQCEAWRNNEGILERFKVWRDKNNK